MKNLIIPTNDVFYRVASWVNQYNACQASLSCKIRSGVRLCLDILIAHQIEVLHASYKTSKNKLNANIPGIYINRTKLSLLTGGSERPIDRYLEKLQRAGLIRKQCRDSPKEYIIWVHPWILLGDAHSRPVIANSPQKPVQKSACANETKSRLRNSYSL